MIDQLLKAYPELDYGYVELKSPLSIARYKEFLAKGYDADLTYLAKHLKQKENPQTLLQKAKFAIVFSHHYIPHPKKKDLPTGLKIASYAKGEDYHHWFKAKMQKIAEELKKQNPQDEFLCFTDSAPVLERDLAIRAGLGWVGKNACLIQQKKGSFFLIGEIYTTLDLKENNKIIDDRCGTCTRCIEACPTKAIKEDRFIDSNLCISYWTIEAKEAPPKEIRKNIEGWHFGCDICQDVCPWNQKAFGKDFFKQKYSNNKEEIKKDLQWILNASNREIERRFFNSPLMRASAKQQRRSAILASVHYQLKELKPDIENLKTRFSELEELCDWALLDLSQA